MVTVVTEEHLNVGPSLPRQPSGKCLVIVMGTSASTLDTYVGPDMPSVVTGASELTWPTA